MKQASQIQNHGLVITVEVEYDVGEPFIRDGIPLAVWTAEAARDLCADGAPRSMSDIIVAVAARLALPEATVGGACRAHICGLPAFAHRGWTRGEDGTFTFDATVYAQNHPRGARDARSAE